MTEQELLTDPVFDRVLDALGTHPRRRLLVALVDRAGDAEALCPAEHFADDAERLRTVLHHRDLPLLADLEYVEWHREADRVAPGPRFGEIAPVLELLLANGDALPDEWV
ncbi:MAG: transcriptional regulator [Haloarculaceae archaeon]